MKIPFSIFFLTLLLGTLACGTTTPQSTIEPAPVIETSSAPPPDSNVLESPVAVPTSESEPALPAPSGLRVVYLRDGDLWSWTDAGGGIQLMDTGDMSTIRVSQDGQLLAFMRGLEVWTVRMDGTDARQLMKQNAEGGALRFAPNGSLLAVSTKDHIDIIDLANATSTTVVTYLAIPYDYFPEIVWTPDSSGFKTVIPVSESSGQAELLFVFTNGTVASLAKFALVSLSESFSYISPDGGYIIYVAKSDDGKQSLYLMDSSGATRPYGESGEYMRALGWLPDSVLFAYGAQDIQKAYLGNIGGQPAEIAVAFAPSIRWMDAGHYYLALVSGELTLGDLSGSRLQIDSNVQDFDFVP